MNQKAVESKDVNLDIVNWLLTKEGNPNAEINFKRVVELISDYKKEFVSSKDANIKVLKMMHKCLHEDYNELVNKIIEAKKEPLISEQLNKFNIIASKLLEKILT